MKLIDETVVKSAQAKDDIFTVLQRYKDFCAQNNIQENHELIY
ncbi:hypothetical protein AB4Z17_03060 [Paenibacillus sp. TAF43_2]